VVFARQQDNQAALHVTERFFEQLAGLRQSHSVTRLSNSTERPTLITISNSLRQLGRIFVNKNNHRDSRREVREQLLSVRNGINQSIFRNFMNAALSFRSWVNIRTVDEATHLRQSFQKQLNNQFLLKQSLQERSFASVVQKFVVSKSSPSSETVARVKGGVTKSVTPSSSMERINVAFGFWTATMIGMSKRREQRKLRSCSSSEAD